MSKKSRKRNKKILAAIGLGLGAAALSSRKKASDAQSKISVDSGRGSGLRDTVDTAKKKETPTVKTDTTIQDNKPVKISKDIAKRSSRGVGDYTDYKPAPKRVNGVLIKGRQNAQPTTPFDPAQGNSKKTMKEALSGGDARGYAGTVNYRKDGGRAGLRSGGKAIKKSMGKALRGGGKVIR